MRILGGIGSEIIWVGLTPQSNEGQSKETMEKAMQAKPPEPEFQDEQRLLPELHLISKIHCDKQPSRALAEAIGAICWNELEFRACRAIYWPQMSLRG